MGVKDGCRAGPVSVKVTSVLLVLANACSWIAFFTASWGYIDYGTYGLGLWRFCDETTDCGPVDGIRTDWFIIYQGFGLLGLTSLSMALLLVILFMFVGGCQGNGKVIMGAAIWCFVGDVSWTVSEVLFAKRWEELFVGIQCHLGFSFVLAIVSSGVSFIAGVFLVCQWICSRKSGTKDEVMIIHNGALD